MTASTPDTPLHTEWPALLRGESRLEWLPAGTIVVVLAGSITLEYPPRWLAGEALFAGVPVDQADLKPSSLGAMTHALVENLRSTI